MSVYDPAEFVKQNQATLSPVDFPNAMRSRRDSSQNVSPSSYQSRSSSASESEGLMNSTALSIGMSRSDSLGGTSFYGGLNMLKIDSQRSESMFKCEKDVPSAFDAASTSGKTPVRPDNLALHLSYTGSMVEPIRTSSVPLDSDNLQLPLVIEENGNMSRTASSNSTSSSRSRISRRSQEQAASSIRPIAPKDCAGSMSRETSSSSAGSDMIRQLSADGSKVAIQKARYQRPTHEKIKCNLCNLKPDGYRGPHELRRHMDNKHTATRKVWICKDISPDQTFLSKCKQCREGKKYGAYYNAACHLRRIHWNPREKGKKADKSGKGRGGNGGGDYPSMDHLKLWMEEIYVPVTEEMLAEERDHEEGEVLNVNADDSQDRFGLPFQSAMFPYPNTPTTSHPTAFPHQEHHHPLGYDGDFEETDFSLSDNFPNFYYPLQEDASTKSSLSPAPDGDSTESRTHCASTPSSATPAFPNSDLLKSAPVNSSLAFDKVESVNMFLTSTMNSPAGQLDQLSSFSFDADVSDFI